MGEPKTEGEEAPRCVGCGRRVKTLYVQYSPGNIRLMKCDNCKAVADPYIECEFMIILLDLILHKTRAYRHLLFNKLHIGSSLDKALAVHPTRAYMNLCDGNYSCLDYCTGPFWCILFLTPRPITMLVRISVSKGKKADGDSSRSMLSTIFNCSEVLGDALLGNIIFMAMLLLGGRYLIKLSFDLTRSREVLLAVIISSYIKFFLLTMMVWEFPSSAIFIVEMFVLSSNVVALRVVTWFPKAHCFGVCFAAHAARYFTEIWLLHTPRA
ncbi:protein arv1 isoform X2 [Brachypodium distachyon]|uniref:protein arv1 isoform X2 n=1 Tax=Brachypodium distachyon TaxID=15368 RepID=UPI0005300950|nr:protein arv1 isoform X2 [Brachypodium distachyon]|eukprot:XP_010228852.1 protein arv1 isoform X2 [Brachypodium distachyon]